MIVNAKELAEIFDCTETTIYSWRTNGMPVVSSSPMLFDSRKSIDWMISDLTSHDLNLNQEKAKLARAQTEKISLETAVRKKELIEVEKISKLWDTILYGIKTKLLNIPKTISVFYEGITSEAELEQLLEDSIRSVLTDLSKGNFNE